MRSVAPPVTWDRILLYVCFSVSFSLMCGIAGWYRGRWKALRREIERLQESYRIDRWQKAIGIKDHLYTDRAKFIAPPGFDPWRFDELDGATYCYAGTSACPEPITIAQFLLGTLLATDMTENLKGIQLHERTPLLGWFTPVIRKREILWHRGPCMLCKYPEAPFTLTLEGQLSRIENSAWLCRDCAGTGSETWEELPE